MTGQNQSELGDSWIDQFLQYSKDFPSPYLFRKWCAISAVACALQRRVKIPEFNKRVTYPNLYIMLVGKPGSGKTTAMTEASNLLAQVGVKLAPRSTTSAALYDAVLSSAQMLTVNNLPLIQSSLACIVDELAVWMPMYDNSLNGLLCSLWDNPHKHDEGRRTKEIKPLENPQLNLLVGVQPAYLGSILPPSAHDMGLLTRCLLIYTPERVQYDLTYGEDESPLAIGQNLLLGSLKRIYKLAGNMSIYPEARLMLEKFHKHSTGLEDLKFENYNTRRLLHVVKLSMIASASLHDNLYITADHVSWAIRTLEEAERFMPEVYKEMNKPETSQVMSECFSWIRSKWVKDKKPIPEHRIIHFLSAKTPATMIDFILKTMVNSRMLKEVSRSSTSVGQLANYDKSYLPVLEHDRD